MLRDDFDRIVSGLEPRFGGRRELQAMDRLSRELDAAEAGYTLENDGYWMDACNPNEGSKD